jgi:dTDP-4-amino-4,6-dideoxygalactose transaminase
VIPTHAPCLRRRDYLPYVAAPVVSRRYREIRLEDVWGSRLGGRAVFPTPTGRHALWRFLELAGLRPGDEVLVAAYNFYAVVRLLVQKGLVPVFVDVEPDTLCIDPDDVRRKITGRSRMVLATHMFGHPADASRIAALCSESGLLLFEDCAHAVGTAHAGRQVGQAGDGALFSFGVQKIVNSFGGGMLVLAEDLAMRYRPPVHSVSRPAAFADTFSRALVSLLMSPPLYRLTLDRAIQLRESAPLRVQRVVNPSRDNPGYRFVPGSRAPFRPFMARMHALQLARLEAGVARRREIVRTVKSRLKGLPEVALLDEDRHGRSNGAYFGVYVADPHGVAARLAARGVRAAPQEFTDCSQLGQFADFAARCPHSSHAAAHVLRLPSYPCLADEDVEHLASSAAACMEPRAR